MSGFPKLTIFIDAAGRYSHSKDLPIVFAGFALETRAVSEVREALLTATDGSLCKWSKGNNVKECANRIFRLLSKRQLIGVVRIVWKNTDEWDRYFVEGQRLYEKAVRQVSRSVSFAKPMATFKIHQFAITCGALIHFYANRNGHKVPGSDEPIQPFQVTAVFDSDIHGYANQEICKEIFQGAGPEMMRKQSSWRIRPQLKVEIKTEEEEPLLLLADHTAGYHYSRLAYGTQPDHSHWKALLTTVTPLINKIPSLCLNVSEETFRESYFLPSDVFDDM
jgi:hypothetical protein